MLTVAEKKFWLRKRPIALFQDIFWTTNNHLMALGPYVPELLEILGPLQIFYDDGIVTKECQYEINHPHNNNQDQSPKNRIYNAGLSLLMVNDLKHNSVGKLTFKWRDFSKTVTLMANPFITATAKLTLNATFKDDEPQWIKNWCLYYHTTHNVSRIILYDNREQPSEPLPLILEDLTKYDLEIWIIPCDGEYNLKFNRLQDINLNHAYYWCMDAASYFLNFDTDEYLVNESNLPLSEYLRKNSYKNVSYGSFHLESYIVPTFSSKNDPNNLSGKVPSELTKDDFKFREKRRITNFYKTIYSPHGPLFIDVHANFRSTKNWACYLLFCKLNTNKNLSRFSRTPVWLQYLLYGSQYLILEVKYIIWRVLMLTSLFKVKSDLYYYHYFGLSSNWLLKEGLSRATDYDPDIHTEI